MYESTSFLSVLVPDTAYISKFLWEGFVTFVKSNAKALLTPKVSKMHDPKRMASHSCGFCALQGAIVADTRHIIYHQQLHFLRGLLLAYILPKQSKYLYTPAGINELCIIPII
jgi:hypothetical protein